MTKRLSNSIVLLLLSITAMPLGLIAATNSSPNNPSFSPGALLAWWFCNSRKRNPIGGWLLFFYWQLYSGLVISSFLVASNIQSYVPENLDDKNLYALFLLSTVPGLALFALKVAVGTFLLSARTQDMLTLMRRVMIAELTVDILGALIDAQYFPDNLPLTFLTIVPNSIWLTYIYKSDRVKHVFQAQDWDVAVQTIHPLKLKMAT